MLDGYGLTEAPGVVTRRAVGDEPLENAIGRPLPHLDVPILDDQGEELPLGETGEICIRAAQQGDMAGVYTPMLGYWRQPEATRFAADGCTPAISATGTYRACSSSMPAAAT